MDQITFHHDTVLSDIHMLLSNTRHLMTSLNSVGQPVFISKFKILSDGERHDNSEPERGLKEADPREDREGDTKATQEKDEGEGGDGNEEPALDEDGDLDITHRRRKNPTESGRDLVCPIILKQCEPFLEEEEDETDTCSKDVVRIAEPQFSKMIKIFENCVSSPKT
ncbi:hypothetical protein L3Q82_002913 [Scortum barcoo]|uniref:Uncharacterized protein n=1 Tax=Scortum barcoo TaxID=214431 RepID=A0ACB8VVD4_9TELE|nr:hypothetical protein L3Q82_002913 [Scortum barcoo]